MGYKERRVKMIATRAAPHLESGERIQTGFTTQTSGIFSVPTGTFVITDRAILIVNGGEAQRLPRNFWFGNPTGVYHSFELDRTYKVHRQWFQEVIMADEALREMQARGGPADGR